MENERCPTCNHAKHEPDKCTQCNCGQSEICHGEIENGNGTRLGRAINAGPLSGLAYVVPARRKGYRD